jgi:uncharacterized repeat protein (TIGR03803 family)
MRALALTAGVAIVGFWAVATHHATAATKTILYSFASGSDGASPYSGLTALNGILYGTTKAGGGGGAGTVFKITRRGVESIVHTFLGGSDGAAPVSSMTSLGGTLYGTTSQGGGTGCGGAGCGTVFTIAPDGTESVLYSFLGGTDGAMPVAGLTNVGGTLYGTTSQGGGTGCGGGGCGTVFSIAPSGTYGVIHAFLGGSGNDGADPVANLVSVAGVLYGTTYLGGGNYCPNDTGCGTVFKLTRHGAETVLYAPIDTGLNGWYFLAGLTNLGGTLYGTANDGGTYRQGVVYSITTSGTVSILHSFVGYPTYPSSDGTYPQTNLLNVAGTLYGTTSLGGPSEEGAVFSITPSGDEAVIAGFAGSPDGAQPLAGLVHLTGALYGTTTNGGNAGYGTVFKVVP